MYKILDKVNIYVESCETRSVSFLKVREGDDVDAVRLRTFNPGACV